MGRVPLDTLLKLAVIVLILSIAANTAYMIVTGR